MIDKMIEPVKRPKTIRVSIIRLWGLFLSFMVFLKSRMTLLRLLAGVALDVEDIDDSSSLSPECVID
jgi:hypothetical protein